MNLWDRRPTLLRHTGFFTTVTVVGAALAGTASAQDSTHWSASWTTGQQGTYAAPDAPVAVIPAGMFQAAKYFPQPDVIRFALPKGAASDQTFRMIVRPDLWSDTIRVRFSNVFGKEPLVVGAAAVGLQDVAADVLPGSNTKVTFNGGQAGVTIAPGERLFSDPIKIGFADASKIGSLRGRNLAVSIAIKGQSSALSYHNTAAQTSYIGRPGSGDHTADEAGSAFPYTTTSLFIIDAVDASAPKETPVVLAFGDSITDGTFSTTNGNDRWPDFLAAKLHRALGDKVSVVNTAISGNAVVSQAVGQPAVERLERDGLQISGVTTVILMEGANDLGSAKSKPEPVIEGYKQVVNRLHKAGLRVIGATLTPNERPDKDFSTSPLGTVYGPLYGSAQTNTYRKQLNDFIRTSKIFDGVVDFEAVTIDPATGSLKAEYVPDSNGGPGDYLHPNRGGYQIMGESIDPAMLVPAKAGQ